MDYMILYFSFDIKLMMNKPYSTSICLMSSYKASIKYSSAYSYISCNLGSNMILILHSLDITKSTKLCFLQFSKETK